jgi:exopolysaccharide biosynthesis polyprenyl glycosylphosphotransferase
LQGIASSAGIGLIVYLGVYFTSDNPLPRVGIAVFLGAAFLLTMFWRLVFIRVFSTQKLMRQVLLVGAGNSANMILTAVNELNPRPFKVVGLVDDDPKKWNTEVAGYKVISSSEQLLSLLEDEQITDVLVAISGEMRGSTFQTLLDAQQSGVEIVRMPVVYEELFGRVPIRILETDWMLRSFVDQFRRNVFYRLAKRALDILGGLVGVGFFALFLPFVGIAIWFESGRPILYSQIRLGRGGEPYKILKFRTMRQDAEIGGQPVLAKEDDERATKVGRFLRKTHIDEIPQFINVLRGQMSLVGPRSERPELVDYYQQYIPFYKARLLVKPGITGWAQVNFGYANSVEDTRIKLEYDLYYIKHRNIVLDILTLLRTPGTMLGMRGQ